MATRVNEWQAHMERLSTLRDKMNALDLESVHFESSNGTDLTVGLADQAVWESAASKSEKGRGVPAQHPHGGSVQLRPTRTG